MLLLIFTARHCPRGLMEKPGVYNMPSTEAFGVAIYNIKTAGKKLLPGMGKAAAGWMDHGKQFVEVCLVHSDASRKFYPRLFPRV
jgi:hypothetical protein